MVYRQLVSEPHSSLSTASFLSSHQHGSVAKEFKLLRSLAHGTGETQSF